MANDIGESLNTHLLAQSAVTAVIADRGFPDVLPQGCAIPAFTYQVVSDEPSHHMGGVSNLRRARVQFDCYATTRKLANQLDELLLAELDMERGTFGGTFCNSIQAEDRIPGTDPPVDGSDRWRYIATRDYMVWYIP